jgi:hypothetical protein
VLAAEGQPVPGLYAVGEVAGFGGGGVHATPRSKERFLVAVYFQVGLPVGLQQPRFYEPAGLSDALVIQVHAEHLDRIEAQF